jgi:hypothetical protein
MQMTAILILLQDNFSSWQNQQLILISIISECKNVYNEIIFNEIIFNISFLFIFNKKIKICYDDSSIRLISLKWSFI